MACRTTLSPKIKVGVNSPIKENVLICPKNVVDCNFETILHEIPSLCLQKGIYKVCKLLFFDCSTFGQK